MNNEVLKNLSYGVYILSTFDNQKSTGCIVNSLIQVTHDTVLASVNHINYTNECIKKNNKFGVSILPNDIEDDVIAKFGFQSGRDIEKFENTSASRASLTLSILLRSTHDSVRSGLYVADFLFA